jgi:hypothetical protein
MAGWGEPHVPSREVLLTQMTKAIKSYILNPTTKHFEAMKLSLEVFEKQEDK